MDRASHHSRVAAASSAAARALVWENSSDDLLGGVGGVGGVCSIGVGTGKGDGGEVEGAGGSVLGTFLVVRVGAGPRHGGRGAADLGQGPGRGVGGGPSSFVVGGGCGLYDREVPQEQLARQGARRLEGQEDAAQPPRRPVDQAEDLHPGHPHGDAAGALDAKPEVAPGDPTAAAQEGACACGVVEGISGRPLSDRDITGDGGGTGEAGGGERDSGAGFGAGVAGGHQLGGCGRGLYLVGEAPYAGDAQARVGVGGSGALEDRVVPQLPGGGGADSLAEQD
ncbi:hypothetical protein PG985_015079 [Apiospora marii]|uniref:Uncharacterized protein n=1 Tax=Apiospora marii TaxID=335849 RepID=A0ABR1RNE9_9PEZI